MIITITEFRRHLGKYLELVQKNGDIFITVKGKIVAKIVKFTGDEPLDSVDAAARQEQALALESKLAQAEQSRLNGEPTVSLMAAQERLEAKFTDCLASRAES